MSRCKWGSVQKKGWFLLKQVFTNYLHKDIHPLYLESLERELSSRKSKTKHPLNTQSRHWMNPQSDCKLLPMINAMINTTRNKYNVFVWFDTEETFKTACLRPGTDSPGQDCISHSSCTLDAPQNNLRDWNKLKHWKVKVDKQNWGPVSLEISLLWDEGPKLEWLLCLPQITSALHDCAKILLFSGAWPCSIHAYLTAKYCKYAHNSAPQHIMIPWVPTNDKCSVYKTLFKKKKKKLLTAIQSKLNLKISLAKGKLQALGPDTRSIFIDFLYVFFSVDSQCKFNEYLVNAESIRACTCSPEHRCCWQGQHVVEIVKSFTPNT